jgi:DNA-binding PadR family transcriptional regulator
MPIPKYTHQQWAVLNTLLSEGELWGRDLRAALKSDGYGSTNASFYELMDRLETAGLVEGHYEARDVLGQRFTERKYKLTELGEHAWDNVASYYAARLRLSVWEG